MENAKMTNFSKKHQLKNKIGSKTVRKKENCQKNNRRDFLC